MTCISATLPLPTAAFVADSTITTVFHNFSTVLSFILHCYNCANSSYPFSSETHCLKPPLPSHNPLVSTMVLYPSPTTTTHASTFAVCGPHMLPPSTGVEARAAFSGHHFPASSNFCSDLLFLRRSIFVRKCFDATILKHSFSLRGVLKFCVCFYYYFIVQHHPRLIIRNPNQYNLEI